MVATSALDMALDDYVGLTVKTLSILLFLHPPYLSLSLSLSLFYGARSQPDRSKSRGRRGRGRGGRDNSGNSLVRGGGAIRKPRGTRIEISEPFVNAMKSLPKQPTQGIPPAMASFRKISISNLAPSVSQSDLLDLFKHIVIELGLGPIQTAQLYFDEKGKSKGAATVVFMKPGHAYLAHQEYHKRTLDNKPMQIELVVGNVSQLNTASIQKPVPVIRGGRGRGRGRGHRRGRGSGQSGRANLSADQLDQDMDVYMGQN
ncbi:hypothetical protein HK096_006225 [Nowakowskiella sp. JEL0078]|nr:hypothetical protein HK096_006225 [Nowakowskiella sp. JEL0078]